jgi:single-strand DNA-binding protein
MNKVIQTVTLGKDPEIKQYGEGKQMAVWTGAVNKRFVKEGEPNADWFNYVAYGKTAEFIGKYFKKGSQMLITGELTNNNYTKPDGTKVFGVNIVVDTVEFFGKKSEGGAAKADAATEAPATTEETPAAAPAADSGSNGYLDF